MMPGDLYAQVLGCSKVGERLAALRAENAITARSSFVHASLKVMEQMSEAYFC